MHPTTFPKRDWANLVANAPLFAEGMKAAQELAAGIARGDSRTEALRVQLAGARNFLRCFLKNCKNAAEREKFLVEFAQRAPWFAQNTRVHLIALLSDQPTSGLSPDELAVHALVFSIAHDIVAK